MTALIAGRPANHHCPAYSLPDPDGCHWCGIARRHHGRRYIAPIEMHGWVRPTRDQRLARMLERRADRIIRRGCVYQTCGTEHPRIETRSSVWCWHHARWETTEGDPR